MAACATTVVVVVFDRLYPHEGSPYDILCASYVMIFNNFISIFVTRPMNDMEYYGSIWCV